MGEVKLILLTNEPLDVGRIAESVKDTRCGGVVTFTGEVRSITDSEDTEELFYEAHESMAVRQMTRIAEEAAGKWHANVAIAHRLGRLLPGEVSVVCVAACPHRTEAFDCCRFFIDAIKTDLPIWKNEHGSCGGAWV